MKNFFMIILILGLSSLMSVAQQVQRNKVVVEIGTGTWCPYCPGAAMGVEDLIEQGYEVAVIKYHNGDDYANTYSNSRNSYYGVPGYPTAYFDGGNSVVGGSATESMFPYYYPKVNARMNVLSSFTIEATGTHTCLSNFTAHVVLNKVGSNSSTNLKLHVAVTESNIQEAWQGMDELDYVCRIMAPSQNGTSVSFASGNVQEFDIPFQVDPEWVLENCEVVIFLQDQSTKEVFQAMTMPLMDFAPAYANDAAIKELFDIPVTSCNGHVAPSIILWNLGSESMNTVNIYYQVNGNGLSSYSWSGALDYLSTEMVTLPEIAFEGGEVNDILVYTSNPNDNPDECEANDARTISFPVAMHTPNTVKLILRTDNQPQETTWELRNFAGDVIDSGGPYTTGGQMVQKTWNLTEEDCYTFNIHDDGGNGLMTPGFYMLYHGSNTTIYQGGVFGLSEIVDFNTADPVGIDENTGNTDVMVYPNPVAGQANLMVSLKEVSEVKIRIYSVSGQKIAERHEGFMSAGTHVVSIDASQWEQGMYLYEVWAGDRSFSGKFSVR